MRYWPGILTMVVLAALCVPARASAQAPDLGAAKTFAVLGTSTVANVGATTITGDLGLSPGTSVTGFPPGQVLSGTMNVNNVPAAAARTSALAAYGDLAGRAMTQDLTGQDLGGLLLTPGVYNFDSSAQLTGVLTLDAQGNSGAVFIFKIGSILTTAAGASVVVINNGSPCNVFWQVGTSATLGVSTQFSGNILAAASITLNTSSTLVGRAFALNGAVTLDTNTVDASSCNPFVCGTLTLAPATLPGGIVGAFYSQTITTSGGSGSYTYAVQSGALPSGLTLSTAGVLSGTPTAAGPFAVVVRATDGNGCVGLITYSFVIAAAGCPVITLAPVTLPIGTVGVTYSQTITSSGGFGSYTYAVQSGALPSGLTLSTAGLLSGTPTASGPFTVVVRATDGNGCLGLITYSFVIAAAACPAITLAPVTLAAGTVGVAYSQTITSSGGSGSYTYAVQAGALPPGLTLSTTGVLSGTPTATGPFTMTVRVTDGNGCPGVITYAIVIASAGCPVIVLAPTILPDGRIGVAYSQLITATGGTGVYAYLVQSGALPSGLTLSTAGLISGTPSSGATSVMTIQGTDGRACIGVVALTLVVPAAVPTLPHIFVALLAAGLFGAGLIRLKRRA